MSSFLWCQQDRCVTAIPYFLKAFLFLVLVVACLGHVTAGRQQKDTLGKRHVKDELDILDRERAFADENAHGLGTYIMKQSNSMGHVGTEKSGCVQSIHFKQTANDTSNVSGMSPVLHRYMAYVYATLENVITDSASDEKEDGPTSFTIKGTPPIISQSARIRRHRMVHMDFNGVFPDSTPIGQTLATHLMLFKHQSMWRQESSPLEIQIVAYVSNGKNSTLIEHTELDNGRHFTAIDISSSFPSFERDDCPTLRVLLQLFAITKHRKNKILDPFKYFMFQSQSTRPLLVKYINILPVFFEHFTLASVPNVLRSRQEKAEGRKPRSVLDNLCSVRRFSFSFKDVNWVPDWLFYPKEYGLNYCAGDCPSPLTGIKTTLYSFVKDLYHVRTRYESELPQSLCVPNDFYRMSFVFHESETASTYVSNLANAIVKSCRCV